MITGKARGREVSTPSIAPLFIDRALPKENRLNNKIFDRHSIENTLGKSSKSAPLVIKNKDPISAIGIPIKKT